MHLKKKGVLVVTVNDYLAKRDAEWMGQIHNFLGLSVGIVLHDMKDDERRAAYACDITYVTNNELGFDIFVIIWLYTRSSLYFRDLHYCIIDEVDSVLIDEEEHLLLFQDRVESLLSYMNCVMCLQDSLLKVHIMVKELRCRL